MATQTHPLVFRNNHLYVSIEGSLWVYDTGANSSFGNHPVSLLGPAQPIAPDYIGYTADHISGFIGETVAGIIGTDLINSYDHIINLQTNTLTVSEQTLTSEGFAQRLDYLMGVPLMKAHVNGIPCRMFFDTGAQFSYYQEALPPDAVFTGTVEDFFPAIGKFTTPTHRFPISLQGFSPLIRCGKLPGIMSDSLSMAGVSGIIGNEVMRGRVTGYFPRRGILILQP